MAEQTKTDSSAKALADNLNKGIKKVATGGNYNRQSKKAVLNPAPAFNFALQVEAAFFVPLKSVRVFTKENEFDYYQEGGLNDYVHMLRKPISKPFTFQIERYVGVSSGGYFNAGFLDPLTLGTDLVLPLVLYVNRAPRESWNSISFANCARAYIFTGCTVISKEFGELNSETSKLATETTTISYREMFTMNQVDPSLESGEPWDIATGKNAHDGNRQAGLATKADQEKKGEAGKWAISEKQPKGNNKFHTQDKMSKDGKPQGEVYGKNDSKAKGMERGEAGKWEMVKDVPGGNKKFHTQDKMSKDGKSQGEAYGRNDPKSKGVSKGEEGKWAISQDQPTGNNKFHTQDKMSKNGTPQGDVYGKNDSKKKGEERGKSELWEYDGSVNGKGKSHLQNRNSNQKQEPVIYPPTRRALKADALSKK